MSTLTLPLRTRLEKLTGGASATPLLVLFGLNFVDELDRLAFSTFTPEIRDAFGLSDAGIVAVNSLTATFLLFAAVPIGMLGDRFARLRIVVGAALVWSSMSVMTGLAQGIAMLMAVRLFAGIGRLANEIVHPSLLTDYYEPEVQPRVFAIHRLANSAGAISGIIAALLAALVTWRGVFVLFAIPTMLLVVAATRLSEPPRRAGSESKRPSFVVTGPRPKKALRRLWRIRTLRWQWVTLFLLGLAIVAIPTFITLFLERVHGVGVVGRGLEKWISGIGSVTGLAISGWACGRATRSGRHDWLARIVAISAASFALSLTIMALVPYVWMAMAMSFAVSVGGAAFQPAYYPLVGMVTPPELKTVSFGWGVMFIAVGAVGGVGIAAVGEAQGYRFAFVMVSALILLAAAAAWYSARFVRGDIEAIGSDAPDDDPDGDGGLPRGDADGPDDGRDAAEPSADPTGASDEVDDAPVVAGDDATVPEFVPPAPSAYRRLGHASLGLTGDVPAKDVALTEADADLLQSSVEGAPAPEQLEATRRAAQLLAAVGLLPATAVAITAPWLVLQLAATPKLLTGAFAVLAGGTLWGLLLAPRLADGRLGGRVHVVAAQLVGFGLLLAGSGRLLPGLFVAGIGAGALEGPLRLLTVDALHPDVRGSVLQHLRSAAATSGIVMAIVTALVRVTDRTPSLAIGLAGLLAVGAGAVALRLAPASFQAEDDTPLSERDRRGASAAPPPLRSVWRHLRTTRSGTGLVGVATASGAAVTLVLAHLSTVATLRWQGSAATIAFWTAAGFAGAVLVARGGWPRTRLTADELTAAANRHGSRLLGVGLAMAAASMWSDLSAIVVVAGGLALLLATAPLVDLGIVLTVSPTRRVAATTILTIAATAGGLVALLLASILQTRVHLSLGIGLAGLLAATAGARLQRTAADLLPDSDRMVDRVMGAAALHDHLDAGGRAPLLRCRGVEFAYGNVQVLHGIDFTVAEGQIVALLGTNGAGKSTLLRVISGLGIPFGGTVRLDGDDITNLDPVARVGRGVVQVPGGKATFGELSVEDNVRAHAFALGLGRAEAERAIEDAMANFPRLLERRHQLAATLSGGERQMLALTKAMLLQPRLLLIDELSLGLAPSVVGELLDLVREINERGTAVVLVEQSVNVALSIADHAYYLEHGEVRFDGSAVELLERPEVLRSVYLSGAAAGLATTGKGAR